MFGYFLNLLYSLYSRLILILRPNSKREINDFEGYRIINSPDVLKPFFYKVIRTRILSHHLDKPKITDYYLYIRPTNKPYPNTGLSDIKYISPFIHIYTGEPCGYFTESILKDNVIGIRLTTKEEKVNIIKNTGSAYETKDIYDASIHEIGY